MNEKPKLTFKFVLVGNGGVGKTSLVRVFSGGEFSLTTEATVGVEFISKTVKVHDEEVKLQIWDTAGQERYRSVGKAYYRKAIGVILVFALNNHESFDSAKRWMQEVQQYCHPKVKILLVGNKCDLQDERQIVADEAQRFAESREIEYLECSALDGTNVEESFLRIARSVYEGVISNEIEVEQRRVTSEIDIDVEERDDGRNKNREKNCC